MITINGHNYAIPLSSAKEKHKGFKNYHNGILVVYETVNPNVLSKKDIWKMNNDGTAKHIMSILNITKMIPLKEKCYNIVDINQKQFDSLRERKYKDLLNKELRFCIANKEKIVNESEKIYMYQMKTGKIKNGYCNFRLLEEAKESFMRKNKEIPNKATLEAFKEVDGLAFGRTKTKRYKSTKDLKNDLESESLK